MKSKYSHPIHGGCGTRLYRIWKCMKHRCYIKSDCAYERYGGRGITVCDEWKSDFSKFRSWAIENGYSDDLTLDRIENSKGYSPDNCRWASMKIQSNNKRNNRFIEYNGENLTIAQWSDKTGIKENTICFRLKSGWSIEETLTIKPNLANRYLRRK